MTRVSLFSSPFVLGFEPYEKAVDRISKSAADAYPPYNVEQRGEDRFRITIAVAGFAPDDLNVQMEGNQLTIRGKQADQGERIFLHRGIAARQFQRSFVLAEGMEVTAAGLDNGLLHIEIERPAQEPEVRSIAITSR
ncbi:MAG: Hsp20 family protein [Pseudomonadota bacterium]